MSEQWRDIAGYEDLYQVSDEGNVRRCIPMGIRGWFPAWGLLSPGKDSCGYLQVLLYRDKARRAILVHRLVLLAFVGDPAPGEQCNHINGKKEDNRLANLEWVSPSQNVYHAYAVLGHKAVRGEQHGRSKLSERQVREIRELYATGNYTQGQLAQEYRIHQTQVGVIVRREDWEHI